MIASAETIQPSRFEMAESVVESGSGELDNYYSVENEISFVRENLHIPRNELEFYIGANVRGFLGEFVGKLPYKVISFIKREGSLEFAQIRMEDSYKRAASIAGVGSREEADLFGFRQVQDQIADNVNVAIQLSPPKNADYSFANIFVAESAYNAGLDGVRVDEYLVRYPEARGSVERSSWLLSLVTGQEHNFSSANDFLMNPVLTDSDDPRVQVEAVLRGLDIGEESIDKGKEFEQRVKFDLESWISEYVAIVLMLANADISISEYRKLENEAKVYLRAIYNRAEEIKAQMDSVGETSYKLETPSILLNSVDVDLIMHYAAIAEPVIMGGSDCGVTKKDGSFMSVGDILSEISSGRTVDQILNEGKDYKDDPNLCRCSSADGPHFHCPGKGESGESCKQAIIVGKGIKKCPSCGEGATCK